jgi:TetR/AcrR family transcriptional regulator
MKRKTPASIARAPRATAGRPKSPPKKRPAAVRRAPGRPRVDGADQRARLIDAALACYVRAGISATSIRDIATEAGVTPALVHYYFGDSMQLLHHVVEERLMPVFFTVREPLQQVDANDPAALIAGFVQSICRAIETYPWWPALWVREVISEGGSLRDLLVKRIAPDLLRGIAGRFAAAQARGQLNAALDPRLLVVSIVGLTLFPAAGAPIWRSIFDAQDLTMKDVQKHALSLLTRGLEVRS